MYAKPSGLKFCIMKLSGAQHTDRFKVTGELQTIKLTFCFVLNVSQLIVCSFCYCSQLNGYMSKVNVSLHQLMNTFVICIMLFI